MGKGKRRDYEREYELQKRRGESGTGSDSGNAKRKRLRRMVLKRRDLEDGDEVDHVVPLSKGGANTVRNARVVSREKNRSFPRNADGSIR